MNSYKVKCLSVSLKLSDAGWRNVVHGYTRDVSCDICLQNPNLTWGDTTFTYFSVVNLKSIEVLSNQDVFLDRDAAGGQQESFSLVPIPLPAGSCWRTCTWCSVMETAVHKGCKLPVMIPPPLESVSDHQLLSQDFLLFIFRTIWELSSFLTPAFRLKISSGLLHSRTPLGRGRKAPKPHRGNSGPVWEGEKDLHQSALVAQEEYD